MAKINGLKIKGVKTFRGHEGETCYQGNLYLQGKKIAFWSNDFCMGPNTYQFEPQYSERKLHELLKKTYPCDEKGLPYDLDLLVSDLSALNILEKEYKKSLKRNPGFPVVAILSRKYSFETPYSFGYDVAMIYNFAEKEKQPTDEAFKERLLMNKEAEYYRLNDKNSICTTFRNLKDFVVGDPFQLNDIMNQTD